MPISIDEVRRIADLAKLEFEPAELERFSRQLGSILDHIQVLRSAEVAELEPPAGSAAREPQLRADEPLPCLEPEEALAGAPDRAADHFRVPRVIG